MKRQTTPEHFWMC